MATRERSAAQLPRPGDSDAVRTAVTNPRSLYDTHFAFVWRNLRRLGVPPSHLDDAAQDVFLVVHRRWDSFDPGSSSVETWLFGIVLRVARNHRRSLRRWWTWFVTAEEQQHLDGAPTAVESPAEALARRETAALFERVLATLKADRRAVFLLVDVEERAVPEAAQALRINLNTAYWRLRAARLDFRRALERARARERSGSRWRTP